MKSMIFFLLISFQLFAQEILNYNFDVDITLKEKLISVNGSIDIDFKNKDTITFILRKNWLNEAFAEYSMLLYIRERMGLKEFQKIVDEYKSRTVNLPPIWGIDRDANDAYSVLYEKGSLILYGMEEMIGKDSFMNFLKEVSNSKIKTTADLLNLIEAKISKEARFGLENKLKTA